MTSNNRTLTKWDPENSDHDQVQQASVWRPQMVPTALRNNDVWSTSRTLSEEKKSKEAGEAAEKKSKRNKTLGRIVAGAVGAALAGAAIHEWEKHKEVKQKEALRDDKESKQRMPGDYSISSHHHSSGSSSSK